MIHTLCKIRTGDDPAAAQLLKLLKKQGYPELSDLLLERVMRLEGLSSDGASDLGSIFPNPILEQTAATSMLDLTAGPVVEVCYQRGVTDPELQSIFHAAQARGIDGLDWARMATRYQFMGVTPATAAEIVNRFLCNAMVETTIAPGENWSTLRPRGQTGSVELIDVGRMDLEALQTMSEKRRLFMLDNQLMAVHNFYETEEARSARDGEIEMIAAAWGDHCSHTTLRALGLLPAIKSATATINHPLVVSAFDDNSGVMRFYAGWALNLKGETHISPSSVATYGGIMTKHGGVIRDIIFTGQGAWPWAGTTIMATCDPRMLWEDVLQGALHPLIILLESIRGTWQYTNPMGIPMAWSQYLVHPNNVKCFALGHSVGILPEARAQKGKPQTGDLVVLIGGKTGNDGLHGATVSSGAMSHETAIKDGAHVQIGMPIEERVFMEAIPVLRDAGCIRACTDCGAAGLSSAVGEIGSNTGVWVNIAWVPLKCQDMGRWEIWLSESQERGVLAVPPGKIDEALAILEAYGVPTIVIGVFTDSKRCQVVYDAEQDNKFWLTNPTAELRGEVVVDLPYTFLTQDCPLPDIEVCEPTEQPKDFQPTTPADEAAWVELVQRHLGHWNICDQSLAAHQYDQTVQGATKLAYIGGRDERMPDELFATTPLLGQPYAAGVANSVNQFYGDVDPAGLGQLMMVQVLAKLAAAGFNPEEVTCNANLYTPRVVEFPENAWRLVQLVKHGYAPASVNLRMPVISGKDSSSGSFGKKDGGYVHAPLTFAVLALGRMPDYGRLIPKAFSRPGDKLILFHPGLKEIHLGGSILLDLSNERGSKLPVLNLRDVRQGLVRYHRMLQTMKWSDGVHSRSVVAEGGLIRRLFEMSIGNGLGCKIDIPTDFSDPLGWLFGELHSAIVFAVGRDDWQSDLQGEWQEIGEVIAEPEISASYQGERLFARQVATLGVNWVQTFTEVAS